MIAPGPGREVVLYRREGCHLCDEAAIALDALARVRGGFHVRPIDIETDERLHRSYLERIPVIELDGRVISELWLDEGALLDSLDTVKDTIADD